MNQPLRVLFMGTSDFAVPARRALRASGETLSLVVTQPDRPAGRGLELKASPVKSAALEMGLEVFQPEKVRTPEAVEKIKSAQPDLAVVAAYGQILPSAVLNIPKLACLNIHGSILPKYRGAAPIHYAVIAGEKETGVTIMYMNEKMDEGDILLSKTTAIGAEETTGEIHDRLAVLGAEGLSEAVKFLKQGKAPRMPQDASKASYAPSIQRTFCRLDWTSPAARLHNRVRGLSPWPGAETSWKGLEMKIHLASAEDQKGKPGEVLEVSRKGILVGAGVGSLRLLEIQPAGKKRMTAFDFSLGQPQLIPGEAFS
jgi:methionyl-tRNA formyltransferase